MIKYAIIETIVEVLLVRQLFHLHLLLLNNTFIHSFTDRVLLLNDTFIHSFTDRVIYSISFIKSYFLIHFFWDIIPASFADHNFFLINWFIVHHFIIFFINPKTDSIWVKFILIFIFFICSFNNACFNSSAFSLFVIIIKQIILFIF